MCTSETDILDSVQQLLENSRESREDLLEFSLFAFARDFSAEWRVTHAEDIERAAQFLVAITTLMEWKALLLLPAMPRVAAEDEAHDIQPLEPVDLETFRQIAMLLAVRHEEQERMMRRDPISPGTLQAETPDPMLRLKLIDLQQAFQRIARRLLTEVSEVRVRGERFSRAECQEWLLHFLQQNDLLRLEQLFEACPRDRAYWVVVFLLLLELVHQRRIGLTIGDGSIDEREVYIVRLMLDDPSVERSEG